VGEGNAGHLVALWPEDGERVWSAALGGAVAAPFAAHQGYLYAAAADEQLYAVQAATGQVAWQQPLAGSAAGWPVAHEGLVVCATAKGELAAFDAGTGESRWQAGLPAPAAAPPAVRNGQVACACADGSLHCFSLDGQPAANLATGVPQPVALLPAPNGFLLQAADGGLHFTDGATPSVALYQPDPGSSAGGPPAVAGRRVVIAAPGAVGALNLGEGAPATGSHAEGA
jgi:outer membrane protein assembly factor BamB